MVSCTLEARADPRSLVAMVLGLLVLLIKIGPSARLDLASIISHTFGHTNTKVAPPAPPPARGNWALGSNDLQIVKDTLAALTTTTDVLNDVPTEAPSAPSEYSFVWNKLRRGGKTSTDLVTTTATKSLSVVPQIRRRRCQCPPQSCRCSPSAPILDNVIDGLIALEAYARWMSDVVTALSYHAAHWLRHEVELEYKYRAALLKDFVKSPTVRVVVEHAVTSRQVMRRAYQHARDRVCANGRCARAADTARDAQARGWRSVLQARRGLDVALTQGQRLVDDTVARSSEFLDTTVARSSELFDGAITGARGVAERAAERYAEKRGEKRGEKQVEKKSAKREGTGKRCKGGRVKDAKSRAMAKAKRGARRARWGKGKKNDPNQRLQCGFRGYARGCGVDVRLGSGRSGKRQH